MYSREKNGWSQYRPNGQYSPGGSSRSNLAAKHAGGKRRPNGAQAVPHGDFGGGFRGPTPSSVGTPVVKARQSTPELAVELSRLLEGSGPEGGETQC